MRNPRFSLENTRNPTAGLVNAPKGSRQLSGNFILLHNLASNGNDDGVFTIALSSASFNFREKARSGEALHIYGDSVLYMRFLAYWEAIAESRSPFTFATSRTYSNLHDHFAWYFPDYAGSDPMTDILSSLEAGIIATHQPAKLRIAISGWDRCRKEFARKAIEMQRKYEMDVRVLLKDSSSVSLEVFSLFNSLPQGSFRNFPARDSSQQIDFQSCFMLIDGPFVTEEKGGSTSQRVSVIGSLGFTTESLKQNSNVWLRVSDKWVFEQLEAHWIELWNLSSDTLLSDFKFSVERKKCR
jgi:hypothetical protein